MRKILSALVLVIGLTAAPIAAHASPVTFDLTLTSFQIFGGNVAGGTGSITVDSAPGNGLDIYTKPGFPGNAITNLTFDIGGDHFTLAQGGGLTSATFVDGILSSLQYSAILSSGKVDINFGSLGLIYSFEDDLKGENSFGLISSQLASATPPAHAPEPSTLMLLGTGILSAAGIARRKFAA